MKKNFARKKKDDMRRNKRIDREDDKRERREGERGGERSERIKGENKGRRRCPYLTETHKHTFFTVVAPFSVRLQHNDMD